MRDQSYFTDLLWNPHITSECHVPGSGTFLMQKTDLFPALVKHMVHSQERPVKRLVLCKVPAQRNTVQFGSIRKDTNGQFAESRRASPRRFCLSETEIASRTHLTKREEKRDCLGGDGTCDIQGWKGAQ